MCECSKAKNRIYKDLDLEIVNASDDPANYRHVYEILDLHLHLKDPAILYLSRNSWEQVGTDYFQRHLVNRNGECLGIFHQDLGRVALQDPHGRLHEVYRGEFRIKDELLKEG